MGVDVVRLFSSKLKQHSLDVLLAAQWDKYKAEVDVSARAMLLLSMAENFSEKTSMHISQTLVALYVSAPLSEEKVREEFFSAARVIREREVLALEA